MNSEWKEMLTLIEEAEKEPTQEQPRYHVGLNESTKMWEVSDTLGAVIEECPLEKEANKLKEELEEIESSKVDESEHEEVEVQYDNFWDAFEVDESFHIHESNDTYCVLGDDTNFHYGTHVDEDTANAQLESLEQHKYK